MHWQPLLAVVAALTVAGVSATPVERAVVAFGDPNVQSVLDADYSQFQPAAGDDGELEQQLYGTFQDDGDQEPTGTGHLSQWSRQNKEEFLEALRNNDADDWVIVMGNEAGDLDSLVSALTLSYLYNHLETPQKAVALLQTEQDALDLRPENALALHYARMSPGHRDLLTIDELPIKPNDLWHRIKGIALVDHNVPRAIWDKAEIVAIIDHHDDRGVANHTADPRIVEAAGSCSSLVTDYLLEKLPGASTAYPMPTYDLDNPPATDESDATMHGPLPKELIELILRTIAIDSDALKRDSSRQVDRDAVSRLFPRSSWKHRKVKDVMGILDDDMTQSRKALGGLDLRSLLRRDWKGDSIATKSKKYPSISIGFASAPVSFEEQIERTPEQTVPEWFAIERAWTSEIQADVTVALTNFRDKKTGEKYRQIALVVAHGYGRRLHAGSADRLFKQLKHAIESAGIKNLEKWRRPDKKPLLARRAVYQYQSADASRKFWRPKIEQAVKDWEG
ncbi:DHH phosphoesterase [Rhodotorula sp. JG-1b]|nr:DHH phosphoesterase [Rhodotorula sp. JG-1b]